MKKTLRFFIVSLCSLFAVASSVAQDVTVAQDGTGNFTTVQAAINAAPSGRTTPYVIYIKNGKYKEKINVPSSRPFLQLVGESVGNVILTYDDYSGKPMPGGGTFGTANSASVTIAAADFAAINITFENTTGEQPQALAINVTGDRAAFKNCRFLGGQDTVYAGQSGVRQYFRNCYIDGTVDFIFGDARAVFDSCYIYPKTRSSAGASYITAANTKQAEPWGYVFRDCKILNNRGTTTYFLGRPWQNDASTADASKSWNKTVFLNTVMTPVVRAEAWSTWDAGTDVSKITFAEYKSRYFNGSPVDVSARVSWSQQLSDAQAANYYNNTNLFGTWDPCAVYPNFCTNNTPDIAVSNFKGVKGSTVTSFNWNISWPMSGITYEVLKSSDRIAFTPVNSQTATNDTAVNFTYSEGVPPPGVTYYYLVRASKAGLATHISNDTVTISSKPTITVTGAMGSFIQGVGTPSTSQSYVVSGASLTNNLIITAPGGYELSTNGGTTWNTSSNPIVLTQDANGNIANTSVSVRLNASSAGTYSGDIIHASVGADTVRLAVTGTVQAEPLTVSTVLEWWPMAGSNMDSAAVRATGVVGTVPTFNRLVLSDGTTVPSVPAYSVLNGQGFGPTATGLWSTPTGPGGNVNRTVYEQFTVTAAATHSLRVDSLILTTSIQNSANGRFAAVYSKTGFTTADSTDIPGAAFASPLVVANETAGNTTTLRFAFAGGTGITLASNETLTFRLYYAVGSGNAGRYAKIKNLQVKGLATVNPTVSDYRTRQTGNWTDLNTWERYDGTTWVYPAPAYPVYTNANTTTVLNGHTVTISATLPNGSGYIDRTTIKAGGQVIVAAGANLNIANDGAPSTATPDLVVDGAFTLLGGLFTNGNVSVYVNGSFVNSGTGMNLSNTGDSVKVGPAAIYQHNVNSNATPANIVWEPTATFLITGITTNQTGIFKNAIKYGNIIWNNTAQANYYAIRLTLDSSNVKGSFKMQSTGTTYVAFANTSGRTSFPGGYLQTGGTVNWRESGTINDTLDLGGDFSVTGGIFNSNAGGTNTLVVRLNGVNKTIAYSQSGATNTNWIVNGSYTLATNLTLPNAGYGVTVNGTLNAGNSVISGAGDFVMNAASMFTTTSASGLNGNLTNTGLKTINANSNFVFNDSAAQVTGSLLPATVNAITINNAADVTLTNSTSVTGALTLTAGRLLLGNSNLTVSSVLGAANAKYVVTNGTGFLQILNLGATNTVFPVGPDATSYNPATINNTGTVDAFSVSVKTSFDFTPPTTRMVNRQWNITEDVVGGSNATVRLSWIIADQAPGFIPTSGVFIYHHNGSSWEAMPATVTGTGTALDPYVANASGFTSFSPFAVGNSITLPVSFTAAKAFGKNAGIQVEWTTAAEAGIHKYVVEASVDGRAFSEKGFVSANNNGATNAYAWFDAMPASGANYYRIKSVSVDGKITYTGILKVNIGKSKTEMIIAPNPVVGSSATLQLVDLPKGVYSLRIYNAGGQTVYSKSISHSGGSYTGGLQLMNSVAPGVYTIELAGADNNLKKTIVVQ